MLCQDTEFKLSQLCLRGKSWHYDRASKIIGLHGWLDNCHTFNDFAPHFSNYNFIAVDMAGHGLSDHRHHPYYVWEYAMDIAELVESLAEPVHIVGHSLGAAVAFLTASLLQSQCKSLTLLEGAVPIPGDASDFAHQWRQAYRARRESRPRNIYPSVDDLTTLRMNSPVSPLDRTRAEALLKRETYQADHGWMLHHDPNLTKPTVVRLTTEQIFSLARAITCPTHLILADSGLLTNRLPDELFTQFRELSRSQFPGDHHFHMGLTGNEVAKASLEFVDQSETQYAN